MFNWKTDFQHLMITMELELNYHTIEGLGCIT